MYAVSMQVFMCKGWISLVYDGWLMRTQTITLLILRTVFVCGSSRIPQNKIIQEKCCGNIQRNLTTHSHRYVWCSGTNFLLLQREVIYWARSVSTSIISTNHHHDNSLIPTVEWVSDWERERESWWMEGRWGTPHYSKFKDNSFQNSSINQSALTLSSHQEAKMERFYGETFSCYTYTYITYTKAEWICMHIRIKDKYLNSIVNTHTV